MGAMEKVSIGIMGDTPQDMAAMAKKAEAAGFDCGWAIELFRNAFTQTTYLGAHTESMDIGTAIAWGFVRSPMTMAMSAMDIDEISGGRFRLGVGPEVVRDSTPKTAWACPKQPRSTQEALLKRS